MDEKILARPIETEKEKEIIFKIRHDVFVVEQEVESQEEFDKFEEESAHFIAFNGEKAVGTARWRHTKEGIKLERFAVLKTARDLGVATKLIASVLEDIKSRKETNGKKLYLHAQIHAIPLYKKFGFQEVGEEFMECNIRHRTMELASQQ